MFGFAMLILGLVISGGIRYYIAPHMLPFIYFGMITFLILSIVQIWRSTAKPESVECDCGADHEIKGSVLKKVLIYSIFVLPLLVGFTIPDQMLGSSIASNRGIQLAQGEMEPQTGPVSIAIDQDQSSGQGDQEDQPATDDQQDVTQQPKSADDYLTEIEQIRQEFEQEQQEQTDESYNYESFNDYYAQLAAQYLNEDTIVITDDNFLDMMTLFELYMEDFVGKEIETIGFVLRMPEFADNQMVAARYAMTCCVADVMPYGLLTQGEMTREFIDDTWVKVTGTLGLTEYPGTIEGEHPWMIPVIHVTNITEVDEPEQPYVYPNLL